VLCETQFKENANFISIRVRNDFVMIDNRLETFQRRSHGGMFMQQTFWDRRRWSHFIKMIRNLILKWCITTQMEVKALCVETEEDVWWLSLKIKDD
jgi:hypothetical protein